MPAQLKPVPEGEEAKPAPEPADEKVRVSRANAEARIAPTREGYVNGAPAGTERWNAVLSTVLQTPRTEQRLLKNPLGIYVNGLSWSRELDSSEGAKP